jgi:hypothetical protein
MLACTRQQQRELDKRFAALRLRDEWFRLVIGRRIV